MPGRPSLLILLQAFGAVLLRVHGGSGVIIHVSELNMADATVFPETTAVKSFDPPTIFKNDIRAECYIDDK